MGLGKTCQLCTHFGSLGFLRQKHLATLAAEARANPGGMNAVHLETLTISAKAVFLIVCPATVLQHWLKEMRQWVPEMRTVIMHSISQTGGEVHKLSNQG